MKRTTSIMARLIPLLTSGALLGCSTLFSFDVYYSAPLTVGVRYTYNGQVQRPATVPATQGAKP